MKIQRKRTVLITILALLVCIIVSSTILGVGFVKKSRQIIPYVNDDSTDWSRVKTVELYGDGCALPPTVTLDSPEQVENLVKEVQNIRNYIKVPSGKWLEGTNDIWVKFDNGVVIGMYRMENYGYIGTDISVTGHGPFWHFPESFRETVFELLDKGDDKVRVFQGESELTPYENFRFGQTYSEHGWVIGDGPFAKSILKDIEGNLPEAVMGEDLEICIPESANTELWGIELFDQSYERIMTFKTKDEFDEYCDEMGTGIYYVSISIIKYGDYIKSEEQNERFGYEYVFRLKKESLSLPLITADSALIGLAAI